MMRSQLLVIWGLVMLLSLVQGEWFLVESQML